MWVNGTDSDVEEEFCKQALPISTKVLEHISLEDAMVSADNYLRYVRYESSLCNSVSVCQQHVSNKISASANVMPAQELYQLKTEDFSVQLEQFLMAREEYHVLKNESIDIHRSHPVLDDGNLEDNMFQEVTLNRLESILLRSNQIQIGNYFDVLTDILEANERTVPHYGWTKWLFSLFACLEVPVVPDHCSSLRRTCKALIRFCRRRGEDLEGNSRDFEVWKFLIYLCAEFFKQRDLVELV